MENWSIVAPVPLFFEGFVYGLTGDFQLVGIESCFHGA